MSEIKDRLKVVQTERVQSIAKKSCMISSYCECMAWLCM